MERDPVIDCRAGVVAGVVMALALQYQLAFSKGQTKIVLGQDAGGFKSLQIAFPVTSTPSVNETTNLRAASPLPRLHGRIDSRILALHVRACFGLCFRM